jgi:transcriptional regulator with XRE-family HTH domain
VSSATLPAAASGVTFEEHPARRAPFLGMMVHMTAARSADDEPDVEASEPERTSTSGPATAPEPERPTSGWTAQMNALGDFIRAQRQLANLSLREMASMTSVSNAYLSQVERGLHQPSLKVLHSIAAALQLSTEQLLAQAGWASGTREAPAGPGSTEEAIRTDPRLSPEQRAALLGVYRSFVEAG